MDQEARINDALRQLLRQIEIPSVACTDEDEICARLASGFEEVGTAAITILNPPIKRSWLQELSSDAWMLGAFGLCVAAVLRVSILMLAGSTLTGPGVEGWLTFLLSNTLSGGAWCLVVCVIGSLIYLKARLGDWIEVLLMELFIIAASAAITGLLASMVSSLASESEAGREIAALLSVLVVAGLLSGDWVAITALREWVDREKAVLKTATVLSDEAPHDIILD